MSINSVFVKTKWLATGKKWGAVPPRVKHAGRQEFLLPDFVSKDLLLSTGISIKDTLAFTLPTHAVTIQTIDLAGYFSVTAPDPVSKSMLSRLHRLPTPSKSVVARLVELCHQAWLDGYQSVRYVHLSDTVTTHCPLWVISFWALVVDLCKNVQKPWVEAKEWLNAEVCKVRFIERKQLAEDAIVFLAALPWDGPPVRSLWHFLSPRVIAR
jgi:hypothetical protein